MSFTTVFSRPYLDSLSRCRPREYNLQIEGSRSLNSRVFIHYNDWDDSSLLSGDSRYTDYNRLIIHYITRYLSRFVSAQIRIIGTFTSDVKEPRHQGDRRRKIRVDHDFSKSPCSCSIGWSPSAVVSTSEGNCSLLPAWQCSLLPGSAPSKISCKFRKGGQGEEERVDSCKFG